MKLSCELVVYMTRYRDTDRLFGRSHQPKGSFPQSGQANSIAPKTLAVCLCSRNGWYGAVKPMRSVGVHQLITPETLEKVYVEDSGPEW